MTDSLATFQGPDPGSPEYVGPCARCAADAAERAVWDALDDLTGNRDFPPEDIQSFRERFGPAWYDMAEWLRASAETRAMEQDNDLCNEHRTTKEDYDE